MQDHSVRLDKWLWAARLYKTRQLAKQAIEGGKVRINGDKVKSSRLAKPGDSITLTQGYEKKTLLIDQLSDQRKGATEAQLLYHETESSRADREKMREQNKLTGMGVKLPQKKPNKKERRDQKKFKINHNT